MKDRTIAVTGAASGIGRAVAIKAARRGARVLLIDRSVEGAADVAGIIDASGGAAAPFGCDVSDREDVDRLFADMDRRGLTADGLVACAGIDVGGLAHELALETWQSVIDVNLNGTFMICRGVLARLVASNRAGSLVLCSSPAAMVGFAAGGATAYSASKGAISAMTRTLAVDYAAHGIRVNAIMPGPTETGLMWATVDEPRREEMRRRVRDEVPLGRLADPEEPANAAIWLLSDEASYVTGSHLVCDGGVLAKASISI